MRKLKVLGLAFVAVFAMGTVVASMAAADQFTAEKYPVTLTGFKRKAKFLSLQLEVQFVNPLPIKGQ